jgi:hypothetical protein
MNGHSYTYDIFLAKPFQSRAYYEFMKFVNKQNELINDAKRIGFEDPGREKISLLVYNDNVYLFTMSTYDANITTRRL